MDMAVKNNAVLNDTLSTFSIILIFVLLGTSLNALDLEYKIFIYALITSLLVIFIARSLATLVVLPKLGARKYLFVAFEGPKGAVAASMATLPVSLGQIFNDSSMIIWGEYILLTSLMTVFLSMILESAWMPFLKKKLLKD